MRALIFAAATVIVLAIVGSAFAADLRVLSEDANALGLIDAEAVEVVGTTRRVKAIAIFAPQSERPASVMVATVLVDCNASRYKIEALDVFDPAMTLTHSDKPANPTWEEAEAVSPFTASAEFSCRGKSLAKASSNDLAAVTRSFLARVR